MKTLQELRDERAALIAAAKELVDAATNEKRDLTEEQQGEVDEKLDAADALQAEIEKRVSDDRRSQRLTDAAASLDEPETEHRHTHQPGEPPERQPGEQRREVRITAPRRPLRHFRARNGETEERMHWRAHASGMWLKARLGNADARQWCRDNELHAIVNNDGIETRVMTEGTNTAGGNLVPEPLAAEIITLRDEFGVARQICDVRTMTSDTLQVPKLSSSVSATWTGEGSAITASDAAFQRVTLTAKKLACLTRISNELIQDSAINIGDYIAGNAASVIAEAEDDAMLNGDGTSTYGGIYGIRQQMAANETDDDVYTAATNTDTYGEVAVADLAGTIGRLPQYAYRGVGPRWLVSTVGRANMFERLEQAGGGTTVVTIQNGLTSMYSGWPIVISQKMSLSTGDLSELVMALFGNFQQGVTVGDRQMITAQTLVERYADTDETAIKLTTRVDINYHERSGSSTAGAAGSIIGLMGD